MKFTRINIFSFLFLSFVLLVNAEAAGSRKSQHTSRGVDVSKMTQQKTKIARQQGRYQKRQKEEVNLHGASPTIILTKASHYYLK